MPTQAKIIEELNFASDVVSTRIRTIAYGVLAVSWGFVVGGGGEDSRISVDTRDLIVPIVLALVALVVDLCQYLAGYIDSYVLLMSTRGRDADYVATYDPRSVWHITRRWCFRAKIALGAAAVVWLVAVLGAALYAAQDGGPP